MHEYFISYEIMQGNKSVGNGYSEFSGSPTKEIKEIEDIWDEKYKLKVIFLTKL